MHCARAVAMRAPLGSTPCGLLLLVSASLVLCQDNGYQPEDIYNPEDVIDVTDMDSICPTERLLRTRELCHVDGADMQCLRLHCCNTHVFIAGKCIPKTVDPCSLKLCEQACEIRDQKIWCTCHSGFQFHLDNYRRKTQPYCTDIDECAINNGGCERRCVNDPGGYHCECDHPLYITADGKHCERRVPMPLSIAIPEPLPLIRASSRCYAPCDTVTWLSRKVKLLSDQLHTTQAALKKLMETSVMKGDGADQFADGTYTNRVLDATAPLEGGYCRCERGPRGPAGPPGMEGPKGDSGLRGPRGARGPKGSLDLMLLMIADIRHDIQNIESRVYKEGEKPERFNLQKAWRQHRKQEILDRESRTEQELEAYTGPPIESPVEVSPNGDFGRINRESTTDSSEWSTSVRSDSTSVRSDSTSVRSDSTSVRGDPTSVRGDSNTLSPGLLHAAEALEKLRQYHLLNTTMDEDEDNDYDYSFY